MTGRVAIYLQPDKTHVSDNLHACHFGTHVDNGQLNLCSHWRAKFSKIYLIHIKNPRACSLAVPY